MFITIGAILIILLLVCMTIDEFEEALTVIIVLLVVYVITSLFAPAFHKEVYVDNYEVMGDNIYIDSEVILRFEDSITLRAIEQGDFIVVKKTKYTIWGYTLDRWNSQLTYKIIPKPL
jgi:hypothetical protein